MCIVYTEVVRIFIAFRTDDEQLNTIEKKKNHKNTYLLSILYNMCMCIKKRE